MNTVAGSFCFLAFLLIVGAQESNPWEVPVKVEYDEAVNPIYQDELRIAKATEPEQPQQIERRDENEKADTSFKSYADFGSNDNIYFNNERIQNPINNQFQSGLEQYHLTQSNKQTVGQTDINSNSVNNILSGKGYPENIYNEEATNSKDKDNLEIHVGVNPPHQNKNLVEKLLRKGLVEDQADVTPKSFFLNPLPNVDYLNGSQLNSPRTKGDNPVYKPRTNKDSNILREPISTINRDAERQEILFYPGDNEIDEVIVRRVIPHELVFPSSLQGYKSGSIQCVDDFDFYYVTSQTTNKCYICVCAGPQPLCLPCEGCSAPPIIPGPSTTPITIPIWPDTPSNIFMPTARPPYYSTPVPYYPHPPLPPRPSPIEVIPPPPPPPLPPPPRPLPLPDVTCNPLPKDKPFDNPLNPCQMCICMDTHTPSGNKDIQIICEENPQCVRPPTEHENAMIIPPPLEPPEPIPFSGCEYYPEQVFFPHPTLKCAICKCTGKIRKEIICFKVPQCAVAIAPTPAYPFVPESNKPVKHLSPLPGPPPHVSCQPFPPNQPFEHPWDTCKLCTCYENRAPGVNNIQVDCYTKLECCIDPTLETGLIPGSIEGKPPLVNGIKVIDSMCSSQTIGVPFTSTNGCKVCICEKFGTAVYPICHPTNRKDCIQNEEVTTKRKTIFIEPNCRYRRPHQPYVIGCQKCTCEPVYNYIISKCTPIPGCNSARTGQPQATPRLRPPKNQIRKSNPPRPVLPPYSRVPRASRIPFRSYGLELRSAAELESIEEKIKTNQSTDGDTYVSEDVIMELVENEDVKKARQKLHNFITHQAMNNDEGTNKIKAPETDSNNEIAPINSRRSNRVFGETEMSSDVLHLPTRQHNNNYKKKLDLRNYEETSNQIPGVYRPVNYDAYVNAYPPVELRSYHPTYSETSPTAAVFNDLIQSEPSLSYEEKENNLPSYYSGLPDYNLGAYDDGNGYPLSRKNNEPKDPEPHVEDRTLDLYNNDYTLKWKRSDQDFIENY